MSNEDINSQLSNIKERYDVLFETMNKQIESDRKIIHTLRDEISRQLEVIMNLSYSRDHVMEDARILKSFYSIERNI